LKAATATARNLGYYNLEAEARLAMAELTMKANPAAARKQLAGLASEAHEHGMELLSRRAQSYAGQQQQHCCREQSGTVTRAPWPLFSSAPPDFLSHRRPRPPVFPLVTSCSKALFFHWLS